MITIIIIRQLADNGTTVALLVVITVEVVVAHIAKNSSIWIWLCALSHFDPVLNAGHSSSSLAND